MLTDPVAKYAGKCWKVEFLEDPGIIELSYWGDMTGEVVLEAITARIDAGHEYDCWKFLIDASQVTAHESVIDALFERVTKTYSEKQMSPESRLAVIEPEKDESKWFLKYYEDLATYRGWDVKRFQDRDAAVSWLVN